MRIGKPLEHAQAAVKSLDIQDSVLKLTTVGRQVGYAGYLVHDMLVWVRPALSRYLSVVVMCEPDPALLAQLHSAKVVSFSPMTYKRIQLRAARLWMTGIACSIVCSIYKLYGLQQREAAVRRAFGGEKVDERKVELKTIRTCVALPLSRPAPRRYALMTDSGAATDVVRDRRQQAATRYQLVQDSLDILIPSGTLGYHSLNDGVIGLAGTVTSFMGLRSQVNKVLGGAK